ncbi:DUF4232 domain-containing protein [Actinomycetospora sp. CA-101289]|uniref:DUF4232 domain-containing protein n=1 Tax=Actinomycetospora sp. CA-101289 TaxID=3239893 RepID=UPI003D9919B7
MTSPRTGQSPASVGVLVLAALTVVLLAGCNPVGARPTTSTGALPTSSTSTAPAAGAGSTTSPTTTSVGATPSTVPHTTTVPATTTTSALPPTARACKIGVAFGAIDATAGSTYRPVTFTNTATVACQLTGGARAELVRGDGSVVGGSTAIEGGTTRLAPGESVATTMRSTATYAFDEDRCTPEPVSGVRITPPADAAPTTLPSPVGDTACNGVIHGQLTFSPLPVAGEGP